MLALLDQGHTSAGRYLVRSRSLRRKVVDLCLELRDTAILVKLKGKQMHEGGVDYPRPLPRYCAFSQGRTFLRSLGETKRQLLVSINRRICVCILKVLLRCWRLSLRSTQQMH